MKPLLVGQAPGPNTDPDLPLFPYPKTSAAGRLKRIMDISMGDYLRTFDRVNVFRDFQGGKPSRDHFPLTTAKLIARSMMPMLQGRTVILVGRKVSEAFGLNDMEYHQFNELQVMRRSPISDHKGKALFAVVPHTSGRNPWYNKEENMVQAKAFWVDVLEKVRLDGK